MTNITSKKQNRILLASLISILTATAVLIGVTGGANRRKNDENNKNDEKINLNEKTQDSDTSEDSTKKDALKNNASTDDSVKGGEILNPSAKDTDSAETDAPTESKDNKKSEDAAASSENDAAPVVDLVTLPEFAAPIDSPVLKTYSDNIPVFSYTMNDYRVHNALDFAASEGTPVYAAADGIIRDISDDHMMGVSVSIEHAGGAVTRYKGLTEESVGICKIGDEVKCGQVIGAVGDTALIESAEESHLHFEMTVNGESVDPRNYFPVTELSKIANE